MGESLTEESVGESALLRLFAESDVARIPSPPLIIGLLTTAANQSAWNPCLAEIVMGDTGDSRGVGLASSFVTVGEGLSFAGGVGRMDSVVFVDAVLLCGPG